MRSAFYYGLFVAASVLGGNRVGAHPASFLHTKMARVGLYCLEGLFSKGIKIKRHKHTVCYGFGGFRVG